MGLANVDGQEFHLVAILLAEVVEGPKLGPERPSREAAEDQDDGLLPPVVSQGDAPRLIVCLQGERRRFGLNSQIARFSARTASSPRDNPNSPQKIAVLCSPINGACVEIRQGEPL